MSDYSVLELNDQTQMRDAVIGRLFQLSGDNKDIMFITADMGAKALDLWREERPDQYRDVGIAEAGAASIAAGMAHMGKKPYIYAIAPFITSRIQEFHKLNAGVQKLPYVTIGMGTGFSYADSGPTHYNTEDIALMRTVPNMEILSPSDSVMAAEFAEYSVEAKNPLYLRLERSTQPITTKPGEDLTQGFRELKYGEDTCIISTGNMVHNALEASNRLSERGIDCGVVDLYRLKPLNESDLIDYLADNNYGKVVSLEEHLLVGGLGSMMADMKVDNKLPWELERIGIDDKLVYFYGRENIQKELGIDADSVAERVGDFFHYSD